MSEQRRAKRFSVVASMPSNPQMNFEQVHLESVNATIEVLDISTTGIGFRSKTELPIKYFVNDKIAIEDTFFYSILKIVRKDFFGDWWHFGCEFVSTPCQFESYLNDYENKCAIESTSPGIPLSLELYDPQISFSFS